MDKLSNLLMKSHKLNNFLNSFNILYQSPNIYHYYMQHKKMMIQNKLNNLNYKMYKYFHLKRSYHYKINMYQQWFSKFYKYYYIRDMIHQINNNHLNKINNLQIINHYKLNMNYDNLNIYYLINIFSKHMKYNKHYKYYRLSNYFHKLNILPKIILIFLIFINKITFVKN